MLHMLTFLQMNSRAFDHHLCFLFNLLPLLSLHPLPLLGGFHVRVEVPVFQLPLAPESRLDVTDADGILTVGAVELQRDVLSLAPGVSEHASDFVKLCIYSTKLVY